MKSITYAFLTHNESEKYLNDSIGNIIKYISSKNDKINRTVIIVDDYSINAIQTNLKNFLNHTFVQLYFNKLNNNFSNQKNFMNSKCAGEWIFNIDADEVVPHSTLENLESIIQENEFIEAFAIPRANIVHGITLDHLKKWHWKLEHIDGIDDNLIMWPDYQWRLYKNISRIKWVNSVHEVLSGYDTFNILPADINLAILHTKDIKRQEEQNGFYESIATNG